MGITSVNIYVGGNTEIRTYLGTLLCGGNAPGNGYHEITGGSFIKNGLNTMANISTNPFLNIMIDEHISANRTVSYSDYSLINLSLNNLWWMNYDGYWGVQKEVVKSNSSYNCINIFGYEQCFPMFNDPPLGPPFNKYYNNYPKYNEVDKQHSLNLRTCTSAVFKITLLAKSGVTLKIYNSVGQLIDTQNVIHNAGICTLTYDYVNEGFQGYYKISSNPSNNVVSYYYYLTN